LATCKHLKSVPRRESNARDTIQFCRQPIHIVSLC
jgi:hypothetical protein